MMELVRDLWFGITHPRVALWLAKQTHLSYEDVLKKYEEKFHA